MNVARIEQYGVDDLWVKNEIMDRMKPNDQLMMARCLGLSEKLIVGLINNKLTAVLGLIPPTLMSEQVYIWLWTTKEAQKHPFVFVRQSQILLADIFKSYDVVVGHCDTRNESAIRWLRWLGAKFEPANGLSRSFTIRKPVNG